MIQNSEEGNTLTCRNYGVINYTTKQKPTKKHFTLILTRSSILLKYDRMDYKGPP